MSDELVAAQPFLRTLAPLLRGLERQLRGWLDARAALPGLACVAARRDSKGWPTTCGGRPKPSTWTGRCSSSCSWAAPASANRRCSTPWPAAPIAQASFTRPTTRDPVVYFHHSVHPDRLDPALRLCRLAQHDRDDAGAEGDRRYAGPRQQRPGQPREAERPAAGRGRRALRRLAGEVPRPARLGAVQGAAAAAGVRVRPEQVGPLPSTPARAGCGRTRTCSAT